MVVSSFHVLEETVTVALCIIFSSYETSHHTTPSHRMRNEIFYCDVVLYLVVYCVVLQFVMGLFPCMLRRYCTTVTGFDDEAAAGDPCQECCCWLPLHLAGYNDRCWPLSCVGFLVVSEGG